MRFILRPNFSDRSTKTYSFNIRNGLSSTVTAPPAIPTSRVWRNYLRLTPRSKGMQRAPFLSHADNYCD
jgi:hypothetical protein